MRGGRQRAAWTASIAVLVMIALVLQLHYSHP
jgi:hypothetical protein